MKKNLIKNLFKQKQVTAEDVYYEQEAKKADKDLEERNMKLGLKRYFYHFTHPDNKEPSFRTELFLMIISIFVVLFLYGIKG